MNNTKKGQAAMEFLMTYGWAILAAVIAIGALAYFGVFSPGKSMPNLCTLAAPLGCQEYQVSDANGITVVVRNGAGSSITVSGLTVGTCAVTDFDEDLADVQANVLIADAGTEDIVVPASCALITSAGNKLNQDLVVTYVKEGNTLPQTSTGRLTAEIVA